MPSYFEKQCVFNSAINHSGGIIISWKKCYISLNSWSTRHTCSVLLRQVNTGAVFTLTNVYGPSDDALKPEFILELKNVAERVNTKWILVGDFNLVRWFIDRPGDMRAINLMDSFNDLIMELQLVDVPLKNRSYTWCNKRPIPSFSKIDRVFMSPEWSTIFSTVVLQAQDMMISDHVPLLLTCKHRSHIKQQPRIELMWLRYPEMRDKVTQIWSQIEQEAPQQLGVAFVQKITRLQAEMSHWHKEKFGQMDSQLKYCKQVISFFDQIEEKRTLDSREFQLRQKIRQRAYDLSIASEIKWKQRARCNWLKNGDNNTRFFHSFASARTARNAVLSLRSEATDITNGMEIKRLFLHHMKQILGTENPALPFLPNALYPTPMNLEDLAIPFSEQEVQRAIRQLAKNKSSGPDGLPNEFLQEYWPELKSDVMNMVNAFFRHELDLRGIK